MKRYAKSQKTHVNFICICSFPSQPTLRNFQLFQHECVPPYKEFLLSVCVGWTVARLQLVLCRRLARKAW
jgi:hypothetical protein